MQILATPLPGIRSVLYDERSCKLDYLITKESLCGVCRALPWVGISVCIFHITMIIYHRSQKGFLFKVNVINYIYLDIVP